MKKKKSISPLLILLLCILPAIVFGAGVTLENKYPNLPGFSPSGDTNLLVYIFNLCVYAAGLIAVLVIVYQGVSIALSKGVVAKVEEAKERIKAALLGLAILFGSYLLLAAINPELTKINLNLAGFDFPGGIFTNNKTDNSVTYKEVPLGSIIEAILMPSSTSVDQRFNYSQLTKKTEEECYLYDKYGNTIDRNGDGVIDGHDVVEGLDMSVCMNNLLNATIAKIKWFNGNQTICNGNISNTGGPINDMKTFIRDKTEGCNAKNCSLWPSISYPSTLPDGSSGYPNGCKTVDPYTRTCTDPDDGSTFDVTGTACESVCGCCGGPRGSTAGTAASCQTAPSSPFYLNNNYVEYDPCKNRQKIDCARQEMNFRIYGHGLDLGLKCDGVYEYSPDIAPFIDEDNNTLKVIDFTDDSGNTYKAQFLTFTSATSPKGAKERMASFKTYFDNRLAELQAATSFINTDKTKNVLSLAEFQSLKESSEVAVDSQPLISDYDPSTYHSFLCQGYDTKSKACNKGSLVPLQQEGYAFLPGETYNNVGTLGEGQKTLVDPPNVSSYTYIADEFADGWPFTQKRVWNNKLADDASRKSDTYNSGDPDTLYILSDAGTTDATKYSAAAKMGVIGTSPTTAQCTLKNGETEVAAKDQISKGSLISNIPIGQLADGMADYVTQLDGIVTDTVKEIQNTIEAADKIANLLPESCNCSNATNQGLCTGGDTSSSATACPSIKTWPYINPTFCESPSCPDAPSQTCGTPACSSCKSNEQNVCNYGCIDCDTTTDVDSAFYYCVRDKNQYFSPWKEYHQNDFTWPGFFTTSWKTSYEQLNCSVTNSANNYSTAYLLKNPYLNVGGLQHCSCSTGGSDIYYVPDYQENPDCQLSSKVSHGVYNVKLPVVCTTDQVGAIFLAAKGQRYGTNDSQAVKNGSMCQCMFNPYSPSKVCLNPNTGQSTGCNFDQLENGTFGSNSPCYALVQQGRPSCLARGKTIQDLGAFWSFTCVGQNKLKLIPKIATSTTTCEGDLTQITDEEKQQIIDANSKKTLIWPDSEDNNTFTYDGLNCCSFYTTSGTPDALLAAEIKMPGDLKARCSVDFTTGASSISVTKPMSTGGTTIKPLPKKTSEPYYVCPYNDVKTEQARIYKQVENPSLTNLANWGTNQDCEDDVPGFLQRIELWQQRLWDYQNPTATNLLPGDENRFTLLDRLNVTRSRFNECVQGFKIENKDAAARTYLFTCEEGLNNQKLGVLKILPQFPPYNSLLPETSSTGQWGCYPFNSQKLTADQRLNCQINPGWSGCQSALADYTPDFYCCLSGQSSTH